MDRLIKTAVTKAGIPLEDAARMASETPARIMGVYDRKGSIAQGKDADIMMFDADLNLTGVIQMGRQIDIAE
jgi:N-acetylglucosamine-6-phosphate deacetylase